MSTPLPALNSQRAPDHLDRSAPDTSVVPLLRRIREQTVVSGPDDEERTSRDDDSGLGRLVYDCWPGEFDSGPQSYIRLPLTYWNIRSSL